MKLDPVKKFVVALSLRQLNILAWGRQLLRKGEAGCGVSLRNEDFSILDELIWSDNGAGRFDLFWSVVQMAFCISIALSMPPIRQNSLGNAPNQRTQYALTYNFSMRVPMLLESSPICGCYSMSCIIFP